MIWCGSLVTHLNESGIVSLLKLFERHLAAGGLMILPPTATLCSAEFPRAIRLRLAQEQIDRIGIHYAAAGYGFEDYPGEKGYGVSLTAPAWIRARVAELGGLREVYFKERGWDQHQDVWLRRSNATLECADLSALWFAAA